MPDNCPAHFEKKPVSDRDDQGRFARWLDGNRYWQTTDERDDREKFEERLNREFPRYASEWTDELSRRKLLQIVGASVALAGASGCFRRPEQKIVPYVRPPEGMIPGVPLHFATTLPVGGFGRGVIVRSDEGRPTKIEGNPRHPGSLGSTDAITQAMLLELYDPERSQSVTALGQISSWGNLESDGRVGLAPRLEKITRAGGKGLHLLTQTITSPTVGALLEDLLTRLPGVVWHVHEPASLPSAGGNLSKVYSFDQARIVLSLDANFLADEPGSLRYARDFIDGRRVRNHRREMNRLYAIETMYSITGAMADHRLAVAPSRVAQMASAIVDVLMNRQPTDQLNEAELRFAQAVARDLDANRGRSLVVAGPRQSPAVRQLAQYLNQVLGNYGATVRCIEGPAAHAPGVHTNLSDLTGAMDRGEVELLAIFDANPAYSSPADVDFASALTRFSQATDPSGNPRYISIRHGLFEDETSTLCHWRLPAAHALESWGDLRAFDGTASLVQPLIAPLYEGRTLLEVAHYLHSRLIGGARQTSLAPRSGYSHELVRNYWRERWTTISEAADFEMFWESCLHDGVIPRTAFPAVNEKPIVETVVATGVGLELNLAPDPTVWDGRFSNNAWLQELPKPITKLTWDNAIYISVKTARELQLTNYDKIELSVQDRRLEAAIWILAGHADGCATLHLGYGRTHAGKVGSGHGFNAFALQVQNHLFQSDNLKIKRLGGKYPLACTQGSQVMDGRDLIRVAAPQRAFEIADSRDQGPATGMRHPLPVISMYPQTPDHAGGQPIDPQWQAWGMVIDNNACIGCNACVIACQAENNIPVVGKDQVSLGRELHWLRIDTYFQGEMDRQGTCGESSATAAGVDSTHRGVSPAGASSGPGQAGADSASSDVHAFFEPILCMQCEKAPCEVVCPVGATLHDVEGLNNMVYNRCVGTRYCSNNCPYKVRRFNFLQYADINSPSLELGRNPGVTVRTKGVMEKCTYCVQRINSARIAAKISNTFDAADKPVIADLSVQTACQQVCPTLAITFGDIGDSQSEVRKLKEEPLNYVLLEDLQTLPRTSYLWRLTNPNTDLTL